MVFTYPKNHSIPQIKFTFTFILIVSFCGTQLEAKKYRTGKSKTKNITRSHTKKRIKKNRTRSVACPTRSCVSASASQTNCSNYCNCRTYKKYGICPALISAMKIQLNIIQAEQKVSSLGAINTKLDRILAILGNPDNLPA